VPPAARFRTVPLAALEGRAHADLVTTRPLLLCPLFQPELAAWGIERRQLIDTLPDAYRRTARWAAAVHAAAPAIQGLVWTSRRCDPECAMMLFGDRVPAATLQVVGTTRLRDGIVLARLRAAGRRAGITLVA
jgi:hypothetical protein